MAGSVNIVVSGMSELQEAIADRLRRFEEKATVVVGYKAPHAVFVHEIGPPDRNYKNGKTHKYLEGPLRSKTGQIIQVVKQNLSSGGTIEKAINEAGNYLLRESKSVVPVDTGELRDSGFVRMEK